MTAELSDHIARFTDTTQFERLCCDLMGAIGYLGVDPQGVGCRDGGKDALFRHPQFGNVVFHFSLRIDWKKKLKEDIQSVLSQALICDQFVFCTNRRATAADKDKFKEYCREMLKTSLEIYDNERIRTVLVARPDICDAYFPHYALSTRLPALVERGLRDVLDSDFRPPNFDLFRNLPIQIEQRFGEIEALLAEGRSVPAIQKAVALATISRSLSDVTLEYLHYVGCVFAKRQMFLHAKKCFEKVVALSENHYSAAYNLAVTMEYDAGGRRYAKQLNPANILRAYRVALRRAKTPADKSTCLGNIGVLFFQYGRRLHTAKIYYLKSLALDSSNLDSRFNIAMTGESWSIARSEYQAILNATRSEERSLQDRCHYGLARCDFYHAKDIRGAICHLHSVRGRSALPECYDLLAEISLKRKRWTKAIYYALKSMKIDYDRCPPHENYGDALHALGRNLDAANAYNALTDLVPQDFVPHERIAILLQADGLRKNFTEIERHLLLAIQKSGGKAGLHYKLGDLYFEAGMLESAKREFEVECRYYPKNSDGYFGLARYHERDGGGQYHSRSGMLAALRYYEQALLYNDNGWGIHFNMGVILYLFDEIDEAIAAFEQADRLSPDNDAVLSNLGEVWFRKGDLTKSRAFFGRALAVKPENQYARNAILEHFVFRR